MYFESIFPVETIFSKIPRKFDLHFSPQHFFGDSDSLYLHSKSVSRFRWVLSFFQKQNIKKIFCACVCICVCWGRCVFYFWRKNKNLNLEKKSGCILCTFELPKLARRLDKYLQWNVSMPYHYSYPCHPLTICFYQIQNAQVFCQKIF